MCSTHSREAVSRKDSRGCARSVTRRACSSRRERSTTCRNPAIWGHAQGRVRVGARVGVGVGMRAGVGRCGPCGRDLPKVGRPHGDDVLRRGLEVERAAAEHEREAARALGRRRAEAVPLEGVRARARLRGRAAASIARDGSKARRCVRSGAQSAHGARAYTRGSGAGRRVCAPSGADQHIDDVVERDGLLLLALVREVGVAEQPLLVADPQPARVAPVGRDAAVRVPAATRAHIRVRSTPAVGPVS